MVAPAILPGLTVCRTSLQPGETSILWRRKGEIVPNDWRLVADRESKSFTPEWEHVARKSVQPWDEKFHHGLRIPYDAPPGVYRLCQRKNDTGVVVTVVQSRPPRSLTRIYPMSTGWETSVEQAWSEGRDVEWTPGYYTQRRPIKQFDDCLGRGYGAVIERLWDGAYANYAFQPARRSMLEGLTYQWQPAPFGTDPARYLYKDIRDEQAPIFNTTLRRVTLRDGQLGEWDRPGCLVEECVLERSAAGSVTGPVLFLRCVSKGPLLQGSNAWSTRGSDGLAIVDHEFLGTDRGPVLQIDRGSVTNFLLCGVTCDHLWNVDNGNELGFERRPGAVGSAADGLILHLRSRTDGWGLLHYYAKTSNILTRDAVIEGGRGVQLVGDQDSPMTDHEFQDVEIRGGRLILGANTARIKCSNVSLIWPKPTRGDQFQAPPDPVPQPDLGYEDQGTDNDLTGLRVYQPWSSVPIMAKKREAVA